MDHMMVQALPGIVSSNTLGRPFMSRKYGGRGGCVGYG
jgi:hypothetical protein